MSLPGGWIKTALGNLSGLVTSGSRGWAKYYADHGSAFIRVQNVQRGRVQLDLADVQHVSPPSGAEGERTRLRHHDVLVSITADLGRIGLFEETIPAYINQHVAMVRLIEPQLAPFIARYLTSTAGQRDLGLMDRGVTRAGLGLDDIRAVPIPLAPLAEQRRIVTKLDALFVRLARARAELDRVADLSKKAREAVYSQTFAPFTKKLKLGSVLEDIRYGTAKKCEYGDGVPVLRIPNIASGRINTEDLKRADFDDDELAKLSLRRGDVLVIRSNGSRDLVGRSAVIDDASAGMLYAGYLIRLRLNESMLLPEYLHEYLSSRIARQMVEAMARSTSGVNNINAEQLKALTVPAATLEAQRSAVSAVRSASARADRLEAEAARARALLDRLEAAILAMAFKGELVPHDPNDEPVSALLERIRAKGAAAAPASKTKRKRQLSSTAG